MQNPGAYEIPCSCRNMCIRCPPRLRSISATLSGVYKRHSGKLDASIAFFADDTVFYTRNRNHKRAIIQLQYQINSTIPWFEKWRLQLNELKTKTIMFNKINTHRLKQIEIKDHYIDWSTEVKYLGITIDRHLSFTNHIRETI